MAIAYDSATTATSATSWSHTCTGSNRFLVVIFRSTTTTTSCTYNGVSMTRIHQVAYNGSSVYANIFYLINPASGSNTVACTGIFSSDGGGSVSYTGVGNIDNSGAKTENQSGTTFTDSLVTVADNSRVIFAVGTGATSQSAGTGAVQRVQGGAGDSVGIYDNNANKTPAGSVSEQVNFGSSSPYGYATFSIKPPIVESVSDAITLSEKLVNGKRFIDTITMIQVVFESVVDSLGLTDIIVSFKKGWNNLTKNSSSFTNQTKNSSTFTSQTKNSSSWSNQTKI